MRIVVATMMVLSAALLAGCGEEQDVGDSGTTTGAADEPVTELTINVDPGPGKKRRTWTLTCDPTGGDHPDAEAACALLAEMERPLAPVPESVACTEIYGGPQTARVTGVLRGEPVDARFDRTDGCEIDRWDRHAALLVVKGGVQAP